MYPSRVWPKTQLIVIDALVTLSPKKKASEFIKKVIELGNADYKIAAPNRGYPLKVHIAEAQNEVSNVCRSRSMDNSAFMLGNMKDIFTNKIKEQVVKDSLYPKSVTSSCSDKLAKVMLMTVAMSKETGKLTNKSLLVETEKRFQAEHSIFPMHANDLTVHSTHFIEGPVPTNLP